MATVKEALTSLRKATKNNNANFAYSNTFARTGALDLLYKNNPYVEVKEEEQELRSSSVDPDKIFPRIIYGEVFLMHQLASRGLSSSTIDGAPVDDFLLYYGEGVNVGVPGNTNFEILNNIYINSVPVYSISNTTSNFKDVLFAENTAGSGIGQWDAVPKQAYIGSTNPITGGDIDAETNTATLTLADISNATDNDVLTFSNGAWRPGELIGLALSTENADVTNVKRLGIIGGELTVENSSGIQIPILNVSHKVITDSPDRIFPGDGQVSIWEDVRTYDLIGAIAVSSDGYLSINLLSVLDGFEVVAGAGISVTKSNVGGKIRYTITRT